MGIRLRYADSGKTTVMINGMIDACGEAGKNIQQKAAKVVKVRVVENLNKLRTSTNEEVYTHMADDVRISKVRNRYGDETVKVQGGKKTGTLWHIVNDGSYNRLVGKRNRATHFLDNALREAETEIDTIIDEELNKVGFS